MNHSARNEYPLVMPLPLGSIVPNALNPRNHFDEEGLQELAESIKAHGVLEPVLVRSRQSGFNAAQLLAKASAGEVVYELVAGERRWRAARLAGLREVPAIVREDLDDTAALGLALVENLQRADLDPIEEARGFARLRELGHTQAQIAAAVGRSQPAVANRLRLLGLPEEVQTAIGKRELTAAHGVALASYAKFPRVATYIAEEAVKRGYTSKQVEDGQAFKSWDLERQGLVKSMDYETHFDWKLVCRGGCPHDAYRACATNNGYCLKPDCWEEHQAEAKKAQQEAVAAMVTRAMASAGSGLLELADLPYDSYHEFSWDKPPAECAAPDCPKYVKAVAGGDQRVVTVCTDTACLASLKNAQGRAEAKVRRAAKARRLKQLETEIEALAQVDDIRAVYLLAADVLGRVYADPMRATLAHLQPEWAKEKAINNNASSNGRTTLLGRVAMLPALAQLQLALEGFLRQEIDKVYEYANGKSGAVDWFLGPEPPAEEPHAAAQKAS